MSSPRLFCPTLTTGVVALPPEERHHATAVLRMSVGDELTLFDGKGTVGVGRIERADRHGIDVLVRRIERRSFDATWQLTLAVAMPRAHRQAYLVEKCTELGAAAIWPIRTECGVAKPGATAVERLRRRAIEAAKQANRAWVPCIPDPQTFEQSVDRMGEFDGASLMHPHAPDATFASWIAATPAGSSVLVWIGPEGGWAESELRRAREVGAIVTGLGLTLLRTETAAVAACAAATLLAPSA